MHYLQGANLANFQQYLLQSKILNSVNFLNFLMKSSFVVADTHYNLSRSKFHWLIYVDLRSITIRYYDVLIR